MDKRSFDIDRAMERVGRAVRAFPKAAMFQLAEETLAALEKKLPRRYWAEINRLLAPFGKHVCTGRLPRCSACPILDMCRQIGVGSHR